MSAMSPASHLPGLLNSDAWFAHERAWFARRRGWSVVPALLPLCIALLAPAIAWGDIYQWTDERGNTIISNVQPAKSAKVSDMELLVTANKPAAPYPAAPARQAATRTVPALEARIENLERQLQAQQDSQQPPDPQSSAAEGYYPAPAPPQSDPDYYGGYDAGYGPGFYPGYYNPWPPSYSFIAVPARSFARRPGFANRPGIVNRPPVFTGRPPVFTGRPPVFTGRPPVFVGRAPMFASSPASGISRSATFAGGSMHRGGR
jgi:hypothetical protein